MAQPIRAQDLVVGKWLAAAALTCVLPLPLAWAAKF